MSSYKYSVISMLLFKKKKKIHKKPPNKNTQLVSQLQTHWTEGWYLHNKH